MGGPLCNVHGTSECRRVQDPCSFSLADPSTCSATSAFNEPASSLTEISNPPSPSTRHAPLVECRRSSGILLKQQLQSRHQSGLAIEESCPLPLTWTINLKARTQNQHSRCFCKRSILFVTHGTAISVLHNSASARNLWSRLLHSRRRWRTVDYRS